MNNMINELIIKCDDIVAYKKYLNRKEINTLAMIRGKFYADSKVLTFSQDEIFTEAKMFVSKLMPLFKNLETENTDFKSLLWLFREVYRQLATVLDNQKYSMLIEDCQEKLDLVLSHLKKTPMKAGYKIKLVKRMLAMVQTDLIITMGNNSILI